jgi:cellobiose phosphorylase
MVFENQYYSQTNPMDGDFPQWFMFDQYYKIRAQDSHADIIVWPLLALGEYLERTNDQGILDEVVPYIEVESMEKKYPEAIKHHVRRLLNNLKRNQMKHTSLPKYGGGDWNDTLQPANSNLTESLVSGWTSALLYQALDVLSLSLKVDTDLIEALNQYKEALKKDYLRYIYQDKHPAGFLQFEDKTEVMFHPNESSNGLKYR